MDILNIDPQKKINEKKKKKGRRGVPGNPFPLLRLCLFGGGGGTDIC